MIARWRSAAHVTARACGVFVRDVGNGLLEVSHNSLALLGLVVVAALAFGLGRPDLRSALEEQALGWLQARQEARESRSDSPVPAEPDAVARATATDPHSLPRPQAAVAQWLSRRYRVAPEPVSALVQEAFQVGQRTGMEPALILAVMAIESRFNPFAQSPVGAQGLMQVMTRVHDDKYSAFGGIRAAFDPLANLRVGVLVLKECIARAGGLEAGLKHYVGAANLPDDGGYVEKVLAEVEHLRQVAAGRAVAVTAPLPAAIPVVAPVPSPAPAPAERAATGMPSLILASTAPR